MTISEDETPYGPRPSKVITAPHQKIARISKETLESSLLGIITARPVYSETGKVVDFEYLSANATLKRTHGIDPDDLVGKTMTEVFPDLRDHVTFPYYCEVAETGEPIVFESGFQSAELDIYVVVSVSRPTPDYVVITFVEVSETIRVTDALAELNVLSGSQVDLETFICGAMEIGCRAVNADRAFQFSLLDRSYNIAWQVGRDDFPVDKKPLPAEIVMELRETGHVKGIRDIPAEYGLVGVSDDTLPYRSVIGAPFALGAQSDGALAFCSAVARRRDPTPSELKLVRTLAEAIAARIRLDTAMRTLEQRNEDLQRFASLVSHDLKAPLRTIRLLSEMVTDYLVDDDQAQMLINEIQGNADQAQNMIKALRDFSRLGAAGLQLEVVDINLAVQDCLASLAADIREANADIAVADMGKALADRTLLSQVLSNLIENALKYADTSNLKIRIDYQELPGAKLQISVSDNGGGVDKRYAERIFELFRRVPGSEQKTEGDGVGLATCRKIVESLGGQIWLDTEFVDGARFCLTLPRGD